MKNQSEQAIIYWYVDNPIFDWKTVEAWFKQAKEKGWDIK